MKMKLYFVSFLILFSFVWQLNAQQSIFENKYSFEAAKELIDIARSIRQGEKIDDVRWGRLFQTEGYHRFLDLRDSSQMKQWIRESLLLAFDPNRRQEADSMAVCAIDLNSPALYPTLIAQNLCRLGRKDIDEITLFLDTLDFIDILERAHRRAKEFLPVRAYEHIPELNHIYILGREADASVRDRSVFLDLNLALDISEQELIDLLAHEFHHNYREMTIRSRPKDPLLSAVNSLHLEGVADLINKHEFAPLDTYGPELAEMYSQDFFNTPETLKKMEALTQAYIEGRIDSGGYAEIGRLIQFGGHTNGFYMALLIKNAGKTQDLIDTYDRPVEFVKLYNEAAVLSGNEHVFSSEFISYLEKLWEEYSNK